jgi:hypothetical protein
MIARPVRTAYGLLFFLCFFLLLSSGRVASSDAGQQLQVATMLALTGRMSDDGSPGGPATPGWVLAPNGRRYQAHDIGNIALMLPAAWIGGHLSHAPVAEQIVNPPVVARVGTAIACSCLAALGCWWMLRLFLLYFDTRTAFLLSLAFPLTTTFLAYSRAAWDVLGASCFVCGVLFYSAAVLAGVSARRDAVLLALSVALACSFRYSLGPFIVPAAALILWTARRELTSAAAGGAVAVFAIVMLPTFIYNAIRTGSMLRPATAAAYYIEGQNALTGNVLGGLSGLLLSPNRGLFVFCPVLLLALFLPLVWRQLRRDQGILVGAYGVASVGYLFLVAKLVNWGTFGWGPRYLVPVLPVLFAASALVAVRIWPRAKAVVLVLATVSLLLNLPAAVVNWHLVTTYFPGASDQYARRPYQLAGGWRALAMGVTGHDLPAPDESRADTVRATTGVFPDLLLARLARQSTASALAAVMLFLGGAAGAIGGARGLFDETA